jgi:hypothetical protein
LQHPAACRPDDVFEAEPLRVRVILLRSGELAQADRHHLHEAAFEPAVEGRMPLHASDDHHRVGGVRGGIHEDLDSIVRRAERDDAETTDDGTAHRLLGNPEMREDVRLSFRGRGTMASHRGKNEWRHSVAAPVLNDALDDRGDVGDATAPDANRDTGAGLKPGREAALFELAARLGPDVGQPEIREVLTDQEQAGRKHR